MRTGDGAGVVGLLLLLELGLQLLLLLLLLLGIERSCSVVHVGLVGCGLAEDVVGWLDCLSHWVEKTLVGS